MRRTVKLLPILIIILFCTFGAVLTRAETESNSVAQSDTTCTTHSYTNKCDTTCNVCGNVRKTTHTYDKKWKSNASVHYKVCTVCKTKLMEKHKYSNATAGKCSVCEHVRYNGVKKIKKTLYYYKKGVLYKPKTLAKYNNIYYYFNSGKNQKSNLMFKYKNTTYHISKGKVNSKEGKLLYKYNKKLYYCQKGKWVKFNGNYTYKGKTYKVTKGIARCLSHSYSNVTLTCKYCGAVKPGCSENSKYLLNNAKLTPTKTNCKILDDKITAIFKKIHKKNMTTDQKVQACYNYLVNNIDYGYNFCFGSVSDNLIYKSDYDYTIVENAYSLLSNKQGVCDEYSAAFVAMCRRIGLNAHLQSGTVSKKGGGRTGHTWTYIIINGKHYVFDPQVQNNNKNVKNYYYCKPYNKLGKTYEKSKYSYKAKDFKNFACVNRPQKNICVDLSLTGTTQTVTTTSKQNGTSTSCDIGGLFENNIFKVNSNGKATLHLDIKGGSGKYIIEFAAYSDSGKSQLVFDKKCGKTFSQTLNFGSFAGKINWHYYIAVVDSVETDSYIIFDNIDASKK